MTEKCDRTPRHPFEITPNIYAKYSNILLD